MKNYEEIIGKINNTTDEEVMRIRYAYLEKELPLEAKVEELRNELRKLYDTAYALEVDLKKQAEAEVEIINSAIAAETAVEAAQAALDDAAKNAIGLVENNAPDIMIIGAMSAKREAQSALAEAKKVAEEISEKVADITSKYEKKDEKKVPAVESQPENGNVVVENSDCVCYSTEDEHPAIRQPNDGDVFSIFHRDGTAKISGINDKYDVTLMFDKSIRDDINDASKNPDGKYHLYFKNEIRWGTLYITGFKPVKG